MPPDPDSPSAVPPRPLSFVGMGASGETDLSERVEEILLDADWD